MTTGIKTKSCFSLNAGQKYCKMFQGEHSAILSTFIKLPIVITILAKMSIFEWLFYTGFTVPPKVNIALGQAKVILKFSGVCLILYTS